MSIIYDALKKVEKNTNRDIIAKVNKERSGKKIMTYLLYVLFACAGLFIANTIFGVLSPKVKPQAAPRVTAPVALKPAKETTVKAKETAPAAAIIEVKKAPEIPPLILNGVFFSKDKGYALINNRVVKQGDFVEGIKVKKVNLDNVELETSGGLNFKLSTQSR
jgi:type II secretory pathway component PulC